MWWIHVNITKQRCYVRLVCGSDAVTLVPFANRFKHKDSIWVCFASSHLPMHYRGHKLCDTSPASLIKSASYLCIGAQKICSHRCFQSTTNSMANNKGRRRQLIFDIKWIRLITDTFVYYIPDSIFWPSQNWHFVAGLKVKRCSREVRRVEEKKDD